MHSARRLEEGREQIPACRKDIACTHDPQCRDPEGYHVSGRLKQSEGLGREDPEDQCAEAHHDNGDDKAGAEGLHQPLPVLGAVIIPHHRHTALDQAVYRHSNQLLDLEIDPEKCHRGQRIRYQEDVRKDDHQSPQRIHYQRRKPHDENFPEQSPFDTESLDFNLNFLISEDQGPRKPRIAENE